MTRLTSIRSVLGPRRWIGVILSLAAFGLFAQPAAEASPIRQFRVSARGAHDLNTWTRFLSGGVDLWSRMKAPHISGAMKRAIVTALQSSEPRSSPWVQYLLWRQGLNPKRFNYYHPGLGPVLEQLPPPTVPPNNDPPKNPNSPEVIIPPEFPEPNTLLIALGLIGAAAWCRTRSRADSQRRNSALAPT